MEIASELYNTLKKANVDAMKAHDTVKRAVLSVLLNKIMLAQIEKREKGLELSDADVVAVLQKSVKELTEEKEAFAQANRAENVETLSTQIEFVQSFLPQMMSEQQIRAEIEKLDDKSIPNVMKHFKANFAGKVDMRDVQTVLKSM